MTFELAEKVARTVLYEGYMLYPYYLSALKNRQRWTFGSLYPRCYHEAGHAYEPFWLRAECLVVGSESIRLSIKLRFLEFGRKLAGRPDEFIGAELGAGEREITSDDLVINDLLRKATHIPFRFTPGENEECSSDYARGWLEGEINVAAERTENDGVFKIVVYVENQTSLDTSQPISRDDLLAKSLLSPHLMFAVHGGKFISLLDPTQQFATLAGACKNVGVFPVLMGDKNTRNLMLAAPIILYDHPQVAPESAGDFFDATEIDELLALRLMTLTDGEKQQIRDSGAAKVLNQAEALSPTAMASLHGSIRMMRREEEGFAEQSLPSQAVAKCSGEQALIFRRGDRVRLCPSKNADIMDIALKGQIAMIESIETDYEGRLHVAVVLDDDPGREFGLQRQPGHRFFFSPEELELTASESRVESHGS
jgi:hypothetical protein